MSTGKFKNHIPAWFLFFIFSTIQVASAQGSSLAQIDAERIDLFRKVSKAVVFLSTEHAFGSGFFVSKDGLILTNHHVVGEAKSVNVVMQDGRKLIGTVTARCEKADFATVKIDMKETPFLRESKMDLKVGMFLASVGHGRGAIWTFNTGLVSNIYPKNDGGLIVFQTQIPLNPGSSGGPIVDRSGGVVGIVTAGMTQSNSINFAISYRSALFILPSLASICNCLVIKTPGSEPIFVDGQMVGKGPRQGIRPTEGSHEVFAIIGGKMVKKTIQFPAEKRVSLKTGL